MPLNEFKKMCKLPEKSTMNYAMFSIQWSVRGSQAMSFKVTCLKMVARESIIPCLILRTFTVHFLSQSITIWSLLVVATTSVTHLLLLTLFCFAFSLLVLHFHAPAAMSTVDRVRWIWNCSHPTTMTVRRRQRDHSRRNSGRKARYVPLHSCSLIIFSGSWCDCSGGGASHTLGDHVGKKLNQKLQHYLLDQADGIDLLISFHFIAFHLISLCFISFQYLII
jgi:hypothetical protein